MNTMPLTVEPENREIRTGRYVAGDTAEVLSQIYRDDCNIVAWQRKLTPELQQDVEVLLKRSPGFQASLSLSPESAHNGLLRTLGSAASASHLARDIAELVDMFCYLFEAKRVGLRLTALQQPMCPRFHIDHVPCRLVSTYQGPAIEWLPHDSVNRSKLGSGNGGKSDELSGLFQNSSDVLQAREGDVLLLKGESWEGNEGAGLVHRSPGIPCGTQRLLLTLDLV